jgi:hypothetical protein
MIGPTIILFVSATAVWALAVYVIPQHVTSLFRYRLWKVRDELQDYILDEVLPGSPVVEDLLETVEGMIEHANNFTLASFLPILLYRKQWRCTADKDLNTDFAAGLCELSDAQLDLFHFELHEVYRATLFKVIAGTPLFALGFPFVLLMFDLLEGRFFASPESELRRLRAFRSSVDRPSTRSGLIASVG